jgi:hypothetical protein
MAITISRGPESSKHWTGPGFRPEILSLDEGVALRGVINYGQGSSQIEFNIDQDSFADLAKAIMEVNKNAAIKAFGQALSQGIV